MLQQDHSGIGDNISAQNYYAEIVRHPTILADVVNALTSVIYRMAEEPVGHPQSFQIQEKLEYNNVIEYAEIFENHKVFQGKLDQIYDELEIQGTGKKTALLSNMNSQYHQLRGQLRREDPRVSMMDLIREHSDGIIADIEAKLLETIKSSSNILVELEFVRVSVRIVLVDAFMRCKILEEPKT